MWCFLTARSLKKISHSFNEVWLQLRSLHYTFFKKCNTCCWFVVVNSLWFDCVTQVQPLSSLHLIAFLLLRLLLLLPSAWLCSYSLRRPDHGKCTHPGCSPPQTEWPVNKQAQHSALGFPEPPYVFQSVAEFKQNTRLVQMSFLMDD